jgi:hypothetical protein
MHASLLLIAALLGGVTLVALGFVAALRKPDKAEIERIRRSDEKMRKASRDDPNEPARFVP